MDKLKAEAAKWATQEEDVLTYAMFPQVAPKFFEKRNAKEAGRGRRPCGLHQSVSSRLIFHNGFRGFPLLRREAPFCVLHRIWPQKWAAAH